MAGRRLRRFPSSVVSVELPVQGTRGAIRHPCCQRSEQTKKLHREHHEGMHWTTPRGQFNLGTQGAVLDEGGYISRAGYKEDEESGEWI